MVTYISTRLEEFMKLTHFTGTISMARAKPGNPVSLPGMRLRQNVFH